MKYKDYLKIIVVTVLCILSVACASKPPQAKTMIQSVEYLNPNIYNQAAPVVVTIYQLKSPTAFTQANYFSLSSNAKSVLGADLLNKREIEVRPNQKQVVDSILSESTNYIGVVAAFRDTDHSQWRQIVEIKKPGKNVKVFINLDSQNLSLKVK